MKHIFLLYLIIYCSPVFAQLPHSFVGKRVIDSNAIKSWPALGRAIISNNGRYVGYFTDNDSAGLTSLVVRSANSERQVKFWGVPNAYFSEDSKILYFLVGDRITLYSLETATIKTIADVNAMVTQGDSVGHWLAYLGGEEKGKWTLLNLFTGFTKVFGDAEECFFDPGGRSFFLKILNKAGKRSFDRIDLENLGSRTIWTQQDTTGDNESVDYSFFDHGCTQMGFTVRGNYHGRDAATLWIYKYGSAKAERLIDPASSNLPGNLRFGGGYPYFSRNDAAILFQVHDNDPASAPAPPGGASVDIWSYRDTVLHSIQLKRYREDHGIRQYMAAIDILKKNIVLPEQADIKICEELDSGYLVVCDGNKGGVLDVDPWWDRSGKRSYYLVSLNDGSKRFMFRSLVSNFNLDLSGQRLLFYDIIKKAYFSYDLTSRELLDISKGIPFPLSPASLPGMPPQFFSPFGVCGWEGGRKRLIINDQYDLWAIDPGGKLPPVNITGGFGRNRHIAFRIVSDDPFHLRVYRPGDTLYLCAFGELNKHSGFFRIVLDRSMTPDSLVFGPWNYYRPQITGGTLALNYPFAPVKARDTAEWLVRRMSCTEAPDYLVTTDFSHFSPVSNLHPERACNWITGQLINWKLPDGQDCQGILYKPENFDSLKRYPVIFNIYQTLSDRLYDFPAPEFMHQEINIPFFVSNGYLVVTPDIHYQAGHTGLSALQSVTSCINYLKNFRWVDSKKLGIEGHSYGGFETNFIITHTRLFAAASSGAGVSDLISAYDELKGVGGLGFSSQGYYEEGQGKMGVTLWERPDLYIGNSPIFKAPDVTTPLLIMHNMKDGNVPWEQGIEFFSALRRLGKPVWMLQYDNEDHVVNGLENSKDYTERTLQFFDHYLKDRPAPVWMTRGIPPALKGIETGYDFQ